MRSNGGLAGLVFVCEVTLRWVRGNPAPLRLWLGAGVRAGLVMMPPLLFQWRMQEQFCAVDPARPYCFPVPGLGLHLLPAIYGHVQSQFWGVGLFKYYTVSNVPQFLLAAPVLVVTMSSLVGACAVLVGKGNRGKNEGWWEQMDLHLSEQWRDAGALYGLWLVLLLVSLTVLHVQVATRFMVASPPLYWHLARFGTGGSAWAARAVYAWAAAFACVGTVLFATFLPWT